MGKVRKEKRHKFLLKTPGAAPGARSNTTVMASQSVEEVPPLPEEVLKSVPIVSLKGTKVEPDQDSEGVMKKKDKRRLKREHWLRKVEEGRSKRREEEAAKQRRSMVIVGDMQPLATSLPTLDTSVSSGEGQKTEKPRLTPRSSCTVLNELGHYGEVLQHPAFQQDPMATIFEHVQNSVALGKV